MDRNAKILVYASAGLLLAFGRYPVSWLLSSRRKVAAPEPLKAEERRYIRCRSGNVVYVEMEGPESAQVIVLLHGLNSSRDQWYYQRQHFVRKYRLVIIDLPGHGNSPKPVDLTIATVAYDVKDVLEHLHITNPILYGHSMGGMIAMEYCSRQLQPAAKGLILQHSTYTNALKTAQFSLLLRFLQKPVIEPFLNYVIKHPQPFRIMGKLNYLNGLSVLFYRYLFYTGEQTAAQLLFTSKIAALCRPEITAQGMLKCIEYEAGRSMRKISVPALVIAANNDRIIQPRAPRCIAKNIDGSRFITADGGHLSLIEFSNETNHVLKGFVAQFSA
ncbi:MAG: alpha/beta hydrolase fold protein [Sphingobacteriaceae bacterium]|jgi:pimeloyl-ACP methyl ester carboxylesterase|nr:alpha/beta hydrolase fold protein [Sphingobacteriaceae bacterium]